MTCYAFRDLGGCEEIFDKHAKDVVDCVYKRWETKGLERKVSKILRVAGHRDAGRLVKDLILISALLHDIGKTAEKHQLECRKSGCTHFPKHYEVSARFALSIAYDIGIVSVDKIEEKLEKLLLEEREEVQYDEGDLYILVVVIPVFLHNYAHLFEKSLINTTRHFKRQREHLTIMVIDEYCRETMLNLVKWLEEEYNLSSSAQRVLNAVSEKLKKNQEVELSVLPLLERDYLLSYKATFGRMLAEATIGIINICDGQVAYKNRKCS